MFENTIFGSSKFGCPDFELLGGRLCLPALELFDCVFLGGLVFSCLFEEGLEDAGLCLRICHVETGSPDASDNNVLLCGLRCDGSNVLWIEGASMSLLET